MMRIRGLIYGLKTGRNCKAVSSWRDCGSSGLNFIDSDPSYNEGEHDATT
jgi:hypothetical protein